MIATRFIGMALAASLAGCAYYGSAEPDHWECTAAATVGNATATSSRWIDDESGSHYGESDSWEWTKQDGDFTISVRGPWEDPMGALRFWVMPSKAVRRSVGSVELHAASGEDAGISARSAPNAGGRRHVLRVAGAKVSRLRLYDQTLRLVVRDPGGQVTRVLNVDSEAMRQGPEALLQAASRAEKMAADFRRLCRPKREPDRPVVIA